MLLLRHQDGNIDWEEPKGEHREQRADRVHVVCLVVWGVRVRSAGWPGQGDHRPVDQESG